MGVLTNILTWIYDRLKGGLALLTTTWGLVTTAITGTAALVGSMFSRFSFWNDITPFLTDAQRELNGLIDIAIQTEWVNFMADWVGIDALAQIVIVCISATVGVTVLVFVTIFAVVFALVPTAIGIRAALKAIQVSTVGYLDP